MKYKPVYKVVVNGETLGYVTNKNDINSAIDDIINNSKDDVAFIIEENMPKYELVLNSDNNEIQNDEILNEIKAMPLVMYKNYAIVINNETHKYVKSIEEANNLIAEMKSKISSEMQLTLGVSEVYCDNTKPEITSDITVAKAEIEQKISEQNVLLGSTINGVTLAKPITGTITSRYGVISRIRSGAHTGLDIANATGTAIKAAATGTVKKAEYSGNYGNLVIIEHENGVETYYGHCSKIYVSVGEKVNTNTTIAAVGSTGNSTGPHLHFEIRVNGDTINPQKYLYK